MSKNHASRIIDALTPARIEAELGMTERALRHAKSVGTFSGLWYQPMKKLCESHGIHCPLEAFSWKQPANKTGSEDANFQGSAA